MIRLDHIGRRRPKESTESTQATQGAPWLLHDINLQITDGERIAVTGPSGAGKTLLLRQIAALDGCDDGTLSWNDQPLADAQIPAYRSHVIYVHQRPNFVEGSVTANLMHPFQFAIHAKRTFTLEAIKNDLTQIGRSQRLLTQDIESLSGGESQLVALLRAIQLDPDVLLLDEPTASADAEMAEAIERLIDDWQARKTTASFVIVSHTETQVRRMARRVIQLESGGITKDELIA